MYLEFNVGVLTVRKGLRGMLSYTYSRDHEEYPYLMKHSDLTVRGLRFLGYSPI